MFIVEIQNRNTHAYMGFLVEEEYMGKIGYGLFPIRQFAHRFKTEREALSAGQDFVGDSTSLAIVVHYQEVM